MRRGEWQSRRNDIPGGVDGLFPPKKQMALTKSPMDKKAPSAERKHAHLRSMSSKGTIADTPAAKRLTLAGSAIGSASEKLAIDADRHE